MNKTKKLILIFVLGLLISPFFAFLKADNEINIYFFHLESCGHCQDMEVYLEELETEYPNINVLYYEVSDDDNHALYRQVVDIFDQEAYVPTLVIGGINFVGYNEQIELDIEKMIIRYTNYDFVDIVAKIINDEEVLITDFDTLVRDTIKLPLIGEVKIETMSLSLAAVLLGFVDGFNPCAMWVLIFLISLLVNMKDKKKMWIIGITFLVTSALVYFLIMVSWLSVAVTISSVNWLRSIIGLIAIIFGFYNINKYIKNKNQDVGCEVTSKTNRNKIIERIKQIVQEKNLLIALIGVIVLAITVNIIELACSAGLPLLYTQILAYNDLAVGTYFLYIGIYILFFLIDDLIIFSIAMITFKVTGISNRYANLSTIIGGTIMLILGFLLIFFPNIIMFNF